MSCAEAEEFYGPVRQVLRERLEGQGRERAAKALETELGFSMPADVQRMLAISWVRCTATTSSSKSFSS